jgi:hypothetical protein
LSIESLRLENFARHCTSAFIPSRVHGGALKLLKTTTQK